LFIFGIVVLFAFALPFFRDPNRFPPSPWPSGTPLPGF
jgi:hypothetical protein